MTRQYEDTVQPEIAPCADCGVLVDEGDASWDDDERLCDDCALARGEAAADEPDEPRCVNAHDRCFMGGSCPYCEVRP